MLSYVTQCWYFYFVFGPVECQCFVNISRMKFSVCSFLFLFVSEIVIVTDLLIVCILPTFYIKAGIILRNFFAWFSLMRLKNCASFWIYAMIFSLMRFANHDQSSHLCWRPAECDVTVTPSVMCIDWLLWWYNQGADIVSPSTALAVVTKVSVKHKSTSRSAIQVKIWPLTISIEEKLDGRNKPTRKRWLNCWHMP